MDITRVQRWVASSLTLTVSYVWTIGMTLGALYTIDQDRRTAQLIILAMTVVVNTAAIVGVRLINQASVLTPWLLAAVIPGLCGALALAAR